MTAARPVVGFPDIKRQLSASYRVDDLLSAPNDAGRFELLDGVMYVVPSPTYDHQDIGALLWFWLRKHAPDRFRASLGTGILADDKTTIEPDVLLVDAKVAGSSHFSTPDRIELVAEVVERSTRSRDRNARPALLSHFGIPHYWRIEQDPIHLFAYDLVDGHYQLVADSDEMLVLEAPFEIELPIRDITP